MVHAAVLLQRPQRSLPLTEPVLAGERAGVGGAAIADTLTVLARDMPAAFKVRQTGVSGRPKGAGQGPEREAGQQGHAGGHQA